MSSNGSGATSAAGLLGQLALGRTADVVGPQGPNGDDVAERRLDRGDAAEQATRVAQRGDAGEQVVAHLDGGARRGTAAAPGCLPKPTTAIFVQPLSIGPLNAVCGLIRLTGRMRSAPAAWASR